MYGQSIQYASLRTCEYAYTRSRLHEYRYDRSWTSNSSVAMSNIYYSDHTSFPFLCHTPAPLYSCLPYLCVYVVAANTTASSEGLHVRDMHARVSSPVENFYAKKLSLKFFVQMELYENFPVRNIYMWKLLNIEISHTTLHYTTPHHTTPHHTTPHHTTPHYTTLRYKGEYRTAGKFGGEFNLAVWRSPTATPNLISANYPCARITQ